MEESATETTDVTSSSVASERTDVTASNTFSPTEKQDQSTPSPESPSTSADPERIMVAGDWHGNGTWAQKAIQAARKAGCDTIVHVGDYGFWVPHRDGIKYLRFVHQNLEECGITLYWVDGNHENHDRIAHYGLNREAMGDDWWAHNHGWTDRIIYRGRGERWTWHDKVWMSLGGAVSVDKDMRTPGRDWWPEETLTFNQANYAAREGKVDVMICHDAPVGVDIPGIHAAEKLDDVASFWPKERLRASWGHRELLGAVVTEVKCDRLFHGHYHVRYDGLCTGSNGWKTHVTGLDCDGARGSDNWVIIDAETLAMIPA